MEKNNKGLTICLMIVSIIAIGGIVGSIYFYNKSMSINNICEDDNKVSNKSNSKFLNIYGIKNMSNEKSLYICGKRNGHCQDIVLTIDTETDNAMILHLGGKEVSYGIESSKDTYSYIAYVDNGLKIYDLNTNDTKKIDLGLSDTEIIDKFTNYSTYKFIGKGFIYNSYEKNDYYYYNLENDKKMFKSYHDLNIIQSWFNDELHYYFELNNYLYAQKDDYTVVLDIQNEKEILKR